jgi:RNA polymerase sigma-70 factor (ECF subfamily)
MKSISLSAAVDGSGAVTDEYALIEAAQKDPAAFGALYHRYLTRVYRYLRAHTTSDDDAADLTQQVFLRALDALPAYRSRGAPFGAWLFRIAHHAVIDAHRRQRSAVTWDTLPESLQPASEADLESDLLHQEALARLRHLLDGLEPDKRELLALRFAAQLSATEIATVVGKSPQAVKKQLTRIIQTLKERYYGA